MRLVVTDANIIIDLSAGGLLEEMFRLQEVEFCIPDVLYVEELATNFGELPALGLKVSSLLPESVAYVETLRLKFRKPSLNYLFALALAKSLDCCLLSGDMPLRDAAQEEAVEVRGTFWMVELLLENRAVSIDRVAEAYEAMKQDGSRLPWDEAEKQLRRWRGV